MSQSRPYVKLLAHVRVQGFYNDQSTMNFEWSGDNSDCERKFAGYNLAADLIDYRRLHPNEPIHVVAHSHGGNVALFASSQAGVSIDTLVTLGTPIMDAYQRGPGVGSWDNVYSTSDRVQTLPWGAGRTSDDANNVRVRGFGHSELHSPQAWNAAGPQLSR
jgi:pimeloyl-ACP methyl ester carboxylesterase